MVMTSKSLFFVSLLIVFVLSIFACINSGCGTNPTSNSEPSTNPPNSGTISGNVYDSSVLDCSTGTYLATPDAIVTVNADGSEETFTATTDAAGYYYLSGLPSGYVLVTVTKEGYVPITIGVNSSRVYLIFNPAEYPDLSKVTIEGTMLATIEDIPEGMIPDFPRVNFKLSFEKKFGGNSGWGGGFHGSSPVADTYYYEYDVSYASDQVLANSDAYVTAICTKEGFWHKFYAYNRLDNVNLAGDHSITVKFNGFNTISDTLSKPAGYVFAGAIYQLLNGGNVISLGHLTTDPGSGPIVHEGMPKLMSGDVYLVSYGVTKEGYLIAKYYAYTGSHSGNADLSSISAPEPDMGVCPSGALSTIPKFKWQAVSGASCYFLTLTDDGTGDTVWTCITTSTEVTFPSYLAYLIDGKTINWSITAAAYTNFPGIDNKPAIDAGCEAGTIRMDFIAGMTTVNSFAYSHPIL